eukprot:gene10973-19812_t
MAADSPIYEDTEEYLESYVTPLTNQNAIKVSINEGESNQYQGLRARPKQIESYELPPIPDRNLKHDAAIGRTGNLQGRNQTQLATAVDYGKEDYLRIVPNNNIEEADIYDDVDTGKERKFKSDFVSDKNWSGNKENKDVHHSYGEDKRKGELPLAIISGNNDILKEKSQSENSKARCWPAVLILAVVALLTAGASLFLLFLYPKSCVCNRSSDIDQLKEQIRLLNISLSLLNEKLLNSSSTSNNGLEETVATTVAATSTTFISSAQTLRTSTFFFVPSSPQAATKTSPLPPPGNFTPTAMP